MSYKFFLNLFILKFLIIFISFLNLKNYSLLILIELNLNFHIKKLPVCY